MCAGLSLASLIITALTATPGVALSPELRAGVGYDSNPFYDAAALPENGSSGGLILRTAPSATLLFNLPRSHRLIANYAAQADLFLSGDMANDVLLRHASSLRYRSAPFGGFRVDVGGSFEQLTFAETAGGWWNIGPQLAIESPSGNSIRATLSYAAGYTDYALQSSNATDDIVASEWAHSPQVALWWSPFPGLLLQPGYRLTIGYANPSSFDSLRHGPEALVSWSPPTSRMTFSAMYGLSLASYDTTNFVEHTAGARLRVDIWRRLVATLAYRGTFTDGASIGDFSRHTVLLSLGISTTFSTEEKHTAPPNTPKPTQQDISGFAVHVTASQAQNVSVVGTFNGWNPQKNPLSRTKNGQWKTFIPLAPGSYRYMIWIDGAIQTPPQCERLVPDGFGATNCAFSVKKTSANAVSAGNLGRKH